MKLPTKETQGIFTVHRCGQEADPAIPVLILVSGFPDAVSTWDPLLPYMNPHFHVVPLAYPGMDPDDIPRLEAEGYWGYSLDEVTAALLAVIQKYRDAGCNTIYLLGHDWGSCPVLKIAHEHPTAVTAVVSEDIGIVKLGLENILILLGYQMLFAWIFLVSRIFPRFLSRLLCWMVMALHPWKLFGPIRQPPPDDSLLRSFYQMYPYFNNYLDILKKGQVYTFRFPKTAFLYIYGQDKRVMFHSEQFLQKLESRRFEDCRCFGYEDAGHWVHHSHPERMAKDMMEFFQTIAEQRKSK
jgi:pimeloyl-ACP methyl ester carboxylesterase